MFRSLAKETSEQFDAKLISGTECCELQMSFLSPLLSPLCLTNRLLACRPSLAKCTLCYGLSHTAVWSLLCSLSGSGRAGQASWEPAVGLGYSGEMDCRVLASQLIYVSIIERRF